MVDHLTRTGKFFVKRQEIKSGKVKCKKVEGTRDLIKGRYSHIRNVKSSTFSKSNPQSEDLMGYEEDYKKLLLYCSFHAPERPLVLTEGKTDPIYLRAALRGLSKKFPSLIEKKGSHFEYKIDFFSFTETNRRILGIDGGTSHLLKFLSYYRKVKSNFHKVMNQYPIIVVLDNDDGAKPFLGCKDSSGNVLTRSGSPFHMFANVYIIFTPIDATKQQSKIEDFFSDDVLKTKIDNKKFNAENNSASKTEYGKTWFATKVVWPRKKKIRFTKFEPLLKMIQDTSEKLQNPA